MNCLGPCDQGRRACPHPHLCEQFDDVPLREVLIPLLWPLGLIAVCAVVSAVGRALAWW